MAAVYITSHDITGERYLGIATNQFTDSVKSRVSALCDHHHQAAIASKPSALPVRSESGAASQVLDSTQLQLQSLLLSILLRSCALSRTPPAPPPAPRVTYARQAVNLSTTARKLPVPAKARIAVPHEKSRVEVLSRSHTH